MSKAVSYTRFDQALLKELEKVALRVRKTDLNHATYKALKQRLGRDPVKSARDEQKPSDRPAGSVK